MANHIQDMAVRIYNQTKSIRKTAYKLSICHQTVRRMLIASGAYTSPTISLANDLLSKGLSIDEVAAQMGLRRNTVLSMTPYTKGTYKAPPSVSALRIRKHRGKDLS